MKAVGFSESLPIDSKDALQDIEVEAPTTGEHDLMVNVQAISVNPVDTKVRMRGGPESGHKILGYDAAGIVTGIGSAVTQHKIGDKVFYAGDLSRPGTNAEFHVVDARIVGRKPNSISMPSKTPLIINSLTGAVPVEMSIVLSS